ncbi:hypothetical protein CGRA01v4_11936 [Colletotrichum graminicola]|nr:hypothetical protein CGRA01v4_11936 [Colletotrichum graminicola]
MKNWRSFFVIIKLVYLLIVTALRGAHCFSNDAANPWPRVWLLCLLWTKRKPGIDRFCGCDCATRTALCSSLDVGEGGFPPSKIYAHKRPPGPLLLYPHRRVLSSLRISRLFSWHIMHLPGARHRPIGLFFFFREYRLS